MKKQEELYFLAIVKKSDDYMGFSFTALKILAKYRSLFSITINYDPAKDFYKNFTYLDRRLERSMESQTPNVFGNINENIYLED